MKRKKKKVPEILCVSICDNSGQNKYVSTGVPAGGHSDLAVMVDLYDSDSVLQKLPDACEHTHKFLALAADVVGVKGEKVVVRPTEFQFPIDERLNPVIIGKHLVFAFCEAAGIGREDTNLEVPRQ